MNTVEFLSYLQKLDIKIVFEDERLLCSAPEGTLTPELRAEIQKRKPEIIAFLKSNTTNYTNTAILPSQEANPPLSFAQQRLWFLDQLFPNNPFYNVPFALRLIGTLDIAALQFAFQEIIRRHDALRTNFVLQQEQPIQVIAPELQTPLKIIDLRHLALEEREIQAQQLITQEIQSPFNLSKGSLLRILLLKLDDTEHILLINLHHIISDGWSIGVLIKEIAAFYQNISLPKLPIQYADFARWQRQYLQGYILQNQLNYWRHQLDNISVLNLPTDRPRPEIATYKGARKFLQLPAQLSQALKTLSRALGVTLFITLLAAFQILLYRYTGQDDIAIGSPIANRNRSEVEGLIGFFVNSLVLRTDLSGNPTFKELLYRVREVALGAYQNQDLPFEKLVELLHPERNLNQNPLFQVVFAMQNAPQSTLELPGLTLSPLQLDYETTRFDLEFHLWEGENVWVNSEGISGFIIYSTDLFDEATITRMLGHFQVLLQGIVNNPEQRIANLPLLTQAEQHQLLVEWNNTHVDYPQDRYIHQLFEQQVEKNSNALALVFTNVETRHVASPPQCEKTRHVASPPQCEKTRHVASPSQCEKTRNFASPPQCEKTRNFASLQQYNYDELNIRSNKIAHYLQKLGVGADVIVGLCVDRSIDLVAGMLGILKAGGAYLPLDPSYPTARLNYMLEDAQVKIVLTQQQWVEHLGEHELQIICLDNGDIAQESEENPHTNITVDNLAYVIYTSGSTGKPKGVQIEHRALLNLVYWHQKAFCISPQDRSSQIASVAFDACVWEIFPYLSAGASLYFPDDNTRRAPEQLQEWMVSNSITISFVPTPLCEKLLLLDWSNRESKLRILLTGGDKLNYYPATEYPFAVVNNYGPTENTVVTTSGNIPTIGRPIANTQIYIFDEHLQPVPIGVKGELYIAGDGLARGYINQPQLTKIYKTGDLGRYLPDGNIEFLGRVDNQVKIRGYRIELEEIETLLNQHPAVQQAVVTTQNTTSLPEKRLTAYIVLNKTRTDAINHVSTQHSALLNEQISQWQMLYNETYSQPAADLDPTFNIVGWNSSYTKAPIPAESLREWVNNQVAQILALQPSRVLEIGCGTGLLLFQIAPHCTKYCGTDFSSVSLNYIRQQLANVETRHVASLQRVTLFEKMATDFEGIEAQAFDAVILNSVVQYFPSIDYLTQVLEGAIQAIAPGGFIFIGDVRSLPLLEAFHAEVELYQAEPSVTREQLRQRVQMQIFQETELVIDPAFFYALKQRFPQISDVQIQLLRGRNDNELTRYRYNAVVKVGAVDPPNPPMPWGLLNLTQNPPYENALTQNPPYQGGQGGSILDWNENNLSLFTLRQLLNKKPETLHITNVPNARVTAAVKTAQWISGALEYKTVGQMREALQRLENLGVDPEDFYALVNELPYNIDISWSDSNTEGRYDILFVRQDVINITPLTTQHSALSTQHSNNPLQASSARKIIPQLQTHLAQKLPEYMVPSAFVVLESLPINQAGKIDRHALPQPDTIKKEFSEAYIAPQTDVEKLLVKIFTEVLGIKRCGIHDNFFELGGHSLLATQLASRVRDAFKVELPLSSIFEAPTIAGLSKVVESLKDNNAKSEAPALVPISRDSRRMKLSSLNKDSKKQ